MDKSELDVDEVVHCIVSWELAQLCNAYYCTVTLVHVVID